LAIVLILFLITVNPALNVSIAKPVANIFLSAAFHPKLYLPTSRLPSLAALFTFLNLLSSFSNAVLAFAACFELTPCAAAKSLNSFSALFVAVVNLT